MNGGEISRNKAKNGGGLNADLIMNGGKIINNTAIGNGGGVHAPIIMNNGEISGNTAGEDGGGITDWSHGSIINGGIISNNTARNGGGIRSGEGVKITLANCLITGNIARDFSGGGVLGNLINITANNVTFSNNQASNTFGGALAGDDLILHNTNITNSTFTSPFTHAYNNADIGYLPDSGNNQTVHNLVVSPQNGVMRPNQGNPTVNFPVSAPGIANGVYDTKIDGLPAGVHAPSTLRINNHAAVPQLQLSGSAAMLPGTYPLTLHLYDGQARIGTSNVFTLTVSPNPGNNNTVNHESGTSFIQTPANPIASAPAAGDTVAVQMSGSQSSVTVNANRLQGIFNADADLQVSSSSGSFGITLSAQAMKDAGINSNRPLRIRIREANASRLQSFIHNAVLLTAANYTVTQGGTGISEFNTPVTLSMDLSGFDLSDQQADGLTGVRINTDGTVTELGGSYDSATQAFSFQTDRLSTYGVIIRNDTVQAPPTDIVAVAALPQVQYLQLTVGSLVYWHNNIEKALAVAPVIENDSTLVPLRFIAEAFGAQVSWQEETETAVISLDDKTISVTVGILTDGMHTSAVNRGGSVLVPLRFIGEIFGCTFDFDESNGNIIITK
jgi:predicted outer membrane repeat protein